ncbi:MAG: hypothetical protein ACR2ND_10330 [Solirubrobacteraceae bacterium]
MRKVVTLMLAVGTLASPAAAVAFPFHPHHKPRAVARLQCNQERRAIGVAQFRAKYGSPNAYRNCVRSHLPSDRAAAAQCRAERKATGPQAFRLKYGGHAPLKHCIALLTTPELSSHAALRRQSAPCRL